uniref:Translation initiation factor IF-2, mitochondrial n=2 Tax=Clastoptera arizonana TaxID=38151 RepID=A0A1B6EDF4_9HEMI
MNPIIRFLIKIRSDLFANRTSLLQNKIEIKPKTYINFKGLRSCAVNYMCGNCRAFHSTSLMNKKRKSTEEKKNPKAMLFPPTSKFKEKKVVDVWKNMTVFQLAKTMGKDVDHVFNVMEYVDNSISFDKPDSVINNWQVIQDVVKKSGFRYKLSGPLSEMEQEEELKDAVKRPPPLPEISERRPPIVTIMGHVDHGKTTLLDSLRNSSVVQSEFGGITQHIGAFSVTLKNGDKVTFLDTPGHAAFSAMRNRGAQVTDIVVLVVAADDGVMEQTIQSLNMAKEAQVPIIVAINKIDKQGANIERTKQMLIQHGIMLEDAGGDVQYVPISALKGTNLDDLVEAIVLQAELMDLKADYNGLVEGVVIESSSDQHRGKLATILVDRGTLRKGAILVAGTAWARVRAMFDDMKQTVSEVTPGNAVQLIGWRILPSPGDLILEMESEKKAQMVLKWREENLKKVKQEEEYSEISNKIEEHKKVYKAALEAKRKLGRYKVRREGPRQKEVVDTTELKLSVIIKGDVDGSVEAILDVLETYTNTECKLDVIHYGVGNVTTNDVELAEAFNAIIYSFNVGALKEAIDAAKDKKITIKRHNVIYKLVGDLKDEIEKLLPFQELEEIIGEANVMQQFDVTEGKKKVPVAGCLCTKGVLKKKAFFRLLREGEIIYEGTLESMRHLKTEVDSIKKDVECGLRLADSTVRYLPGDTIVCYIKKKEPRKSDWDPGF